MKQKTLWMTSFVLLWCLIAGRAFAGINGPMSAITYRSDPDLFDNHRIYVFTTQVVGIPTHLGVYYRIGLFWQSADQGAPPGTAGIREPNAITYQDDYGHRWIYVFAVRGLFPSGGLFMNYWSDVSCSNWRWGTISP